MPKLRLAQSLPVGSSSRAVAAAAQEIAGRSPYGWGHTIDFGPFTIPGLLGDDYLGMPLR